MVVARGPSWPSEPCFWFWVFMALRCFALIPPRLPTKCQTGNFSFFFFLILIKCLFPFFFVVVMFFRPSGYAVRPLICEVTRPLYRTKDDPGIHTLGADRPRVFLIFTMALKLTSLNVKGLNSPNKRRLLLRTLKSDKVDIAFIQEIDLVTHAKAVLTDHVFTREFSSRALSKRNGVSILIRKSCPFQVVSYKCDVDGRYVLLSGSLYSKTYHFLNVYAPNASASDFWSSFCDVLDTLPHGAIVLGGDMNATPCLAVDRSDRPVLSGLPSVSTQDKTFA
uniref:exodeoxyribonuclease III n=1 Tax=Leptobrachium leishanense TaxID=445787 RepID=A0A8C5LU76_9ANUR